MPENNHPVSSDIDDGLLEYDIEHLRSQLKELVEYRMPFGKYSGSRLIDLPEPYVVWFSRKGFPKGRLGELLGLVYEIKVNGLEYLFDPLK